MKGSAWIAANQHLTPGPARRSAVDSALESSPYFGGWCRVPYALGTLLVSCDVVSIGEAGDYYRVPLDAAQSQRQAERFGAFLPTAKISDLIHQEALKQGTAIAPQGLVSKFSDTLTMMHEVTAKKHNELINAKAAAFDEPRLLAGHKKDVVLSNRLVAKPQAVAIYGFHQLNGAPIQGESTAHEKTYYDYSHGTRLVQRHDLEGRDLLSLLQSQSASALTYDPPLKVTSYDKLSGSGTFPSVPHPGTPTGPGSGSGGQNHAQARALVMTALPAGNLPAWQLAQAVGLFESSYGKGFPGTHNWGAVLCGHLPPCKPGCKEHLSGVCLKVYGSDLEGVQDYISVMLKRPAVVAAMQAGDLAGFTLGMGTPPVYSELAMNSPGLYSQKIGAAVSAIAKALGEPDAVNGGGGPGGPVIPFPKPPSGAGQGQC